LFEVKFPQKARDFRRGWAVAVLSNGATSSIAAKTPLETDPAERMLCWSDRSEVLLSSSVQRGGSMVLLSTPQSR